MLALRYVLKALYQLLEAEHEEGRAEGGVGLSKAGGTALPVSLEASLAADACHDLGSTAGGSVV